MIPYHTKVEKPWGYEIIFTPPAAAFCGKILHVAAGKRLSLQYHDKKTESLCLIKGEAILTVSGEKGEMIDINMEAFYGYFIQKGQTHRITAISDCDVVESSTPQTGTTIRIEDDSGRGNEILSS